MTEEIKTVQVFCAREQQDTNHTLTIDDSGEIVLTCVNNIGSQEEPELCGRFIKYPKDTDLETLKGGLVSHKNANLGQLSTEAAEEKTQLLIDGLNEK